jgi:hypothetical protein
VSSGLVIRQADGADVRYGAFGLVPYALVVHERTDTHHPVGQHHYLSAVVLQATGDMAGRLAADMASRLRP